jgi:hypothetical protein
VVSAVIAFIIFLHSFLVHVTTSFHVWNAFK